MSDNSAEQQLVSVKKDDLLHLVASNLVLGVLSNSIKIVNAESAPSSSATATSTASSSASSSSAYASSRKFLNQQRW
jgi:hypothetical protein